MAFGNSALKVCQEAPLPGVMQPRERGEERRGEERRGRGEERRGEERRGDEERERRREERRGDEREESCQERRGEERRGEERRGEERRGEERRGEETERRVDSIDGAIGEGTFGDRRETTGSRSVRKTGRGTTDRAGKSRRGSVPAGNIPVQQQQQWGERTHSITVRSELSDPVYMSRKIRKFRTDKFDT